MAKPRSLSPKAVRKLWLALGSKLGDELAVGAAILATFLVVCGFLFSLVEKGHNPNVPSIGSGFKWLTLTLLTAGSPFDITTAAGNVIYYFVLVSGLGLVAMATGAVASKLVEFVLRRSSGMGEAKVSNHIVICGWSSMGDEILRELHAEEVDDKRPVVILANLESSPTRDELTTFIKGNPSTTDDLLRAGIDRADTAIVLADESNTAAGADERDAKTLLTTLAVESVAPNCYTCVEVIRSENKPHFERTKADELVVSAELTGALLAESAIVHGLSRAVSDLLTHPVGNEIYSVEAGAEVIGKTFNEALTELKHNHDCVLIGISPEGQHHIDLNPDGGRLMAAGDRMLVIAKTGFSTSKKI